MAFPSILRAKRILLTTESFGPVNGVSRTTTSLVEYLRRHGVDIVVVAPQFEGADSSRDIRLPGYPLPYNPDLTVVYPFRLDDIYNRSFQPDLIYVASPASLGFQVLLQTRQLRSPPVVLLNFQTDLSAYSEIIFPAPLARFAVWLLATVQGYLFRHAAVRTIFYPCTAVLDYLKTAHAPIDRCVQLGRGVDTALFHPSRRDDAYRAAIAPNGELILVCVCRLAPEKGFEFLARAATKLAETKLAFTLLIVGGNRNPAVQTRIQRLFDPVRDRVVFTGFLTGLPLARAYASADVFLHCSVTETFGLVVLEAMASGLPVVARDQGGPSDIVRDGQTGYLVPPEDLDRFVAVVREVAARVPLREGLATAARLYAEETTWENINHRVACRMAEALADGRELERSDVVLSIGERLRITGAVCLVYLMWLVAVVPLLIHGQRIVPRAMHLLRRPLGRWRST
jgi:glycosyltransferase involved in cell wall biosynthesis